MLALFLSVEVYSQGAPGFPSRNITAQAIQELNFGDVTLISGSAGGTVTVNHNGDRTSTGSVILMHTAVQPISPAIYEFRLCPGKAIAISYLPTVTLTGSNGGSLILNLGSTNFGPSGATFISNSGCDDIIRLYQGGTLNIGSIGANPAGEYSGVFEITFVQQ